MKCQSCGCENEYKHTRFCTECGASLSKASQSPIDHNGASPGDEVIDALNLPSDEGASDPRQLAKWRNALEAVFRDGLLTDAEEDKLARMKNALSIGDTEAETIRREVEERFRKRVLARIHRSAFEPAKLGSHVVVQVELENLDPSCEHIEANCGYVINGLKDPQSQTLGLFPYPDVKKLVFEYDADHVGVFDAQLRVVLEFRDSAPVVLCSRPTELRVVVEADAPTAAQHVYNIGRLVGDVGVDKSISVGSGPSLPQVTSTDEALTEQEWRTIILEYSADTCETESERPSIIERPAQYRVGEILIETPSDSRRITFTLSAIARMGRNRIAATNDCPQDRTNDIQLRVEPTNEPENAKATGRITGYGHATLCCYGDRISLSDNSTHGTTLNRLQKLNRGEDTEIGDRTSFCLADVLELECEVYRSAASAGARPLVFSTLPALKSSPDALNGLLVGFDKDGEIDVVRIRRLNNLQDKLEHLVVVRQARIGSGMGDVIRLSRCPGIVEHHARLLVDRGQLWIERLHEAGPVKLIGAGDGERDLIIGSRVGLRFGDILEIGDARLTLVPGGA